MLGSLMLPVVAYFALSANQGTQSPNLIVATGMAESSAVANAATVFIPLVGTGETEAAAEALVKNRIDGVTNMAMTVLPDQKAYKTLAGRSSPEYDQENVADIGAGGVPVRKFKGVRVDRTLQVTVNDLSQLAPLTKAVEKVEGGYSISYGLKDAAAARRSILKAAFDDAKARATEAAEAAGMKLGDVYLIEAGQGPAVIEADRLTRRSDDPILTRQIVSRATVTVRFRLVK